MDKLKKAPEIIQNLEIPQDIPHGDMPGDKVEIEEVHINKARTIFPLLVKELEDKNLRISAEMINSLRRKDEDTARVMKYANESLISDLLININNELKQILSDIKLIYITKTRPRL